ncbi:hypothetical protein GCM10029964_050190 [Kibdelosporangium lantanae]
MNEAKLLRCVLRAGNAIVNDEPFERILGEALHQTVGADTTTVTMWRYPSGAVPLATVFGQDAPPTSEMRIWAEKYGEHPYFAHLLRTRDPRPYRTSDLMPFRAFRDTDVYRDLLAQYGLRHQLAATLRFTDRELGFIGLMRGGRDFSDREVDAVARVRDAVAAALAYESAVRAIRARIGPEPHVVPRGLSLTERENQVLRLVAAGHTNDQTAMRLGITTRTVRKHLESVFAKARVSSRAAAVAWWLRQPRM